MTRPSVVRLVLALAVGLSLPASALEVRDVRWGFDGKVVAEKFNILSVLVDEPGPAAFDGPLSLVETRGGETTVGAPQTQQVFVTPGTQRWVQFTPFISSKEEWKLRWGKDKTYTIDKPATDAPATVLLLDPNSPFVARAQLRAFPEDLFPTSVAATDGLDQMALDHVPRWDAPRREAFLDWLRRGGVLHVLRGSDGYPVFDGDLGVLNTTLPRERVGAGTVVRHDVTPAECNPDFLQKAGFPLRGSVTDNENYPVVFSFHQMLLQKLASLTKANVQWWLLYLLTIAYLVIIGPVHYRWSRKADYRVAIAGFLGIVAAFAIAFIFAGSRGAGESQTVHTVAIAHSLGEKRWDVMQWGCAFATTGDNYRLTHAAPWNLYAMPSETESVNGHSVNGKGGYFEVDIPLYSSRPFMHRAVMNGPAGGVQVLEWKADRVVLKGGADFPKDVVECIARRGDRMLQLNETGTTWVWDERSSPPVSVDDFFNASQLQKLSFDRSDFDLKQSFSPLAAFHLGNVKGLPNRISTRSPPPDQLQLMLSARASESFTIKGKGFHGEKGWVLYVIDLFRPET